MKILIQRLRYIARHNTAMTLEVREACVEAASALEQQHAVLEAVDSEIALTGGLKELVDSAIAEVS